MKTVDVIIIAYQAHDTIDKAIASVVMQKLPKDVKVTITIVNDAGDGYQKQRDKWSKVITDNQITIKEIARGKNGGAGLARQSGIDGTNGDYILFLDSDDALASPLAISWLVKGMTGEDGKEHDMCMGNFLEEMSDGTVKKHTANQIWMHGKMISRKALERLNVRFNDTRESEDVGFNSIFFRLTEDIFYVDYDVYVWQNREGSTVRTDKTGYHFGYGWRSLIENTARACEELQKRGEDTVEFVTISLCQFYFQFMEATWMLPTEIENNRNKLVEFYQRAVKPVEDKLENKKLIEEFVNMQDSFVMHVIPKITFYEYMNMINGKAAN